MRVEEKGCLYLTLCIDLYMYYRCVYILLYVHLSIYMSTYYTLYIIIQCTCTCTFSCLFEMTCFIAHVHYALLAPRCFQMWVSVHQLYCSDRSAEYNRQLWLNGGPPQLQTLLWHGPERSADGGGERNKVLDLLRTPELGGLEAVRPLTGWAHIQIPGEN